MTLTLAYDPTLSRVRASGSGLTASSTAQLERSTDGIRWRTVRGGAELAVSATGALPLPVDDYEFAPDVLNTYRLRTFSGELELSSETATITPELGGVPWLKVVAQPFLNRPVTVQDYGEIARPARSGVFSIVGRSLPVVISDVRSGDQLELTFLARSTAEASDLRYALAPGDVLLLQVPADADVPSGYFAAGDVTETRPARTSPRRLITVPLTEVEAPAPEIVGTSATWASVIGLYATWADVVAAYATWTDLLELIGRPEDVIVQ